MTQPLLFDDCLSILQKILLLARKLNELIEDYNKFKEDFFQWKEEVDAAIADLQAAAGGLAAALALIDKEKITNLVIKGKLSAADIKVIRAAEGKLAELDTLDLSEVTLVPSDEYYYR